MAVNIALLFVIHSVNVLDNTLTFSKSAPSTGKKMNYTQNCLSTSVMGTSQLVMTVANICMLNVSKTEEISVQQLGEMIQKSLVI